MRIPKRKTDIDETIMKRLLSVAFLLILMVGCTSRKVEEWVVTTPDASWQSQDAGSVLFLREGNPDAVVDYSVTGQTIEGFGACFNELGWLSLSQLDEADRVAVMKELFEPGTGANLNVCRLPIAANDFARDWYSFDETDGDFEMKDFSIDNDKETLIPFIKEALSYNPDMKLWATPWSPPLWMKDNKHYACQQMPASSSISNGLRPDQVRREGVNMFIQDKAYFEAYALYFSKFIQAYREEGIDISMVMPQNEFNSCQNFPSCTWTATGLAEFVGKYLGPEMKKIGVEVMFGTMERPDPAMAEVVLDDPFCREYVSGIGFQWAGKEALPEIHRRYPEMTLYQTEQECGNGQNDWEGCEYSWELMKHYLKNGVNVYDYWNISLEEGGMSRWGWHQNSFVTINKEDRTSSYTYEYYLFKHVSYFVKPGASFLPVTGDYGDLLAFLNPDGQCVLILHNPQDEESAKILEVGGKLLEVKLKPNSFNTIVL